MCFQRVTLKLGLKKCLSRRQMHFIEFKDKMINLDNPSLCPHPPDPLEVVNSELKKGLRKPFWDVLIPDFDLFL